MFQITAFSKQNSIGECAYLPPLEYLVDKENLLAIKTDCKLDSEILNDIAQSIKEKSILLAHFSKKKKFYIFVGYSLISNTLKIFSNKIKVEKIINDKIVGNCMLIKLLELECEFYLNLDDALDYNNSVSVALVHQCVLVLLRQVQKTAGEINAKLTIRTVNDFHKLEDRFFTNMNVPIPSIEEMARSVNMSTSKFKNVFFEVYSCTPHQYFLNIKLKMACNTLHFSNMLVSEVSNKFGFNHPSGFSRFIKSKLGVSPLEFNSKIK